MIRTIALLTILATALCAQSPVALTLSNASTTPGGTAALNLNIATSGATKPAAVQFTVSYPASVTNVSVIPGAVGTAAGKSMSCSSVTGKTSCILVGINQNTIADGVAGVLSLTAGASGSFQLALSNTAAVSAAGSALAASGNTATLSVFARGDLNSDGAVDLKDLQILIQQILDNMNGVSTPPPASDQNNDAKVDLQDLQVLANNAH